MKIDYDEGNRRQLWEVKTGEGFGHNGALYQKVNAGDNDFYANLEDGYCMDFDKSTLVSIVKLKVVRDD